MDRRRNAYPVRRRVAAGMLAAGGLALTATACDSTGSTAPNTSFSLISPQSPTIWGMRPDQVPFPGRIALPNPGDVKPCSPYGLGHPMPPIIRQVGNRLVTLVVVDARDSYPPKCDPNQDSGAGMYSAPSVNATPRSIDGSHFYSDGQVAEVRAWSFGQLACNADHAPAGSNIWLELSKTPNGTAAWTAQINTDQAFTASQLQALDIQQAEFAGVAGTVENGCPLR